MAWTDKCYSRLLIDNHITDLEPDFMSRFDPEEYVRMVKASGVESSMVYACDHNGNCYYPTKAGHIHSGLKGRDIFGETVSLLRKSGIVPVAYYTSIYHNNSAKGHPAWRITLPGGAQHGARYWWCCPNSDEYVEFALGQVREVCAYDVDGIFNDMTFWPGICVCPSCREKFLKTAGHEIPLKIDWQDKGWLAFQRFREKSMACFAQRITDAAKGVRPGMTATHQGSLVMGGWLQGYSLGLAEACDYASGDFYGGKYQHVLGAKVMAAVSTRMPFEFMTSRCSHLRDHTSMKSEAEMTVEAATTLANGGAYFFIDAINPNGTLEPSVYERLGAITAKLAPFRGALKRNSPEIHADLALYYSSEAYIGGGSEFNIMSSTQPPRPAVDELYGMSIVLTRAHVPFRVVHRRSASFEGLKTIIMNNISYLEADECERLRNFVAQGGTLIATGASSLYQPDGSSSGDFALADVFGVKFTGRHSVNYHYLSFADRHWLVSCASSAPLVEPSTAKTLAMLLEPNFAPEDERYASIHSNPPGRETQCAALTVNKFGKGRCVYLASSLLSIRQTAQQEFGAWLLGEFVLPSIIVETNAPPCVEIAVLKSSKPGVWLVSFVNYQAEQPNVPVHGVSAKIKLPSKTPKSCIRVSDGAALPLMAHDGCITLVSEKLENIEMFEIEF